MKFKFVMLFVLISFTLVSQKEIHAQNTFPYGVWLNNEDSLNDMVYSSVRSLWMNIVIQYAPYYNQQIKDKLSPFNLVVVKEDTPADYISYYSRGYYTKWESVQNQLNPVKVGVQHNGGGPGSFNSAPCWSSQGVQDSIPGLVKGPDYRQDKNYRLNYDKSLINYTVNFQMAYSPATHESHGNIVCRIGVRLKSLVMNGDKTRLDSVEFISKKILVSDFNSAFKKFTLGYDYGSLAKKVYDDTAPGTGIEFFVDFLGQGTLYINFMEVYDNAVWGTYFMDDSTRTTSIKNIKTFANNYSKWSNLQYFYAADEPQTIDQYEPIRFVDSILRDSTSMQKPIISAFYPQWDGGRNGEITAQGYKIQANPRTIMTDYYPFWAENNYTTEFDFRWLQVVLQQISHEDKHFWYMPQAFGEYLWGKNTPAHWRKPSNIELNASIMLALAHGAKGLIFWKMTTTDGYEELLGGPYPNITFQGILDTSYKPTDMYHYLKNSFSPRINGILGRTLFNLEYSEKFVVLKKITNPNLMVNTPAEYLSLSANLSSDCNFHAGLLNDTVSPMNKYFFLINLFSERKALKIKTDFTNENYTNYFIKDVETGNSITYDKNIEFPDTLDAGEGKLYNTAPVVLFGGNIKYNESISGINTLSGEMTIKSGAELTISGTYNINNNILIESGGKLIVTAGAVLNFLNGSAIINKGGTLSAPTSIIPPNKFN
jgi:hypothetical protein